MSRPPSPYWQVQGTPYHSSEPGPAGWPTTPTTPHTYTTVYPTSAPAWAHGGAQPAPATRGGYIPWVGGQAPSGSSPAYSPWTAPAGAWGTPTGGAPYDSAFGQPVTAAYFGAGQGEVDAHGFPVDRLGRSHSQNGRKRSKSRHRRNSSHGRTRFDLTINDGESDATADWAQDSAFASALRRSNSHEAGAARYTTTPQHMHRSISWGNEPTHDPFFSPPATGWDPNMLSAYQMGGAQEHLPPYLQGDVYDENNLAKRPRDWRADYVPRQSLSAGLANLVLGKGRSDVRGTFAPPFLFLIFSFRHFYPLPLHCHYPPFQF